MQIQWVFNDCTDGVKAPMRAYWEKKRPRLERLLQHYQPDLQCLRMTAYAHMPGRYEIRASLHLPTGTLVAEYKNKDFAPILDRLADLLAREIKRHVEHLPQNQLHRRMRRRRQRLVAVHPFSKHPMAQCETAIE